MTDPNFAVARAVEALWDCEEHSREIAVRSADRTLRLTEEGLRRIATDEFETNDFALLLTGA